MENKKDNQRETIIFEMILWIFFFAVIYMFTKVLFW